MKREVDRLYCATVANTSLAQIVPLSNWTTSSSSHAWTVFGWRVPFAVCGTSTIYDEARDPCLGLLALLIALLVHKSDIHRIAGGTVLSIYGIAEGTVLLLYHRTNPLRFMSTMLTLGIFWTSAKLLDKLFMAVAKPLGKIFMTVTESLDLAFSEGGGCITLTISAPARVHEWAVRDDSDTLNLERLIHEVSLPILTDWAEPRLNSDLPFYKKHITMRENWTETTGLRVIVSPNNVTAQQLRYSQPAIAPVAVTAGPSYQNALPRLAPTDTASRAVVLKSQPDRGQRGGRK